MADNPKIFGEWEKVDCNDCQHYWQDACDGVSEGSQKPCLGFKATREVVIPAKLKSLENRFKWLRISLILTDIALVIHLLTVVVGG